MLHFKTFDPHWCAPYPQPRAQCRRRCFCSGGQKASGPKEQDRVLALQQEGTLQEQVPQAPSFGHRHSKLPHQQQMAGQGTNILHINKPHKNWPRIAGLW